MDDEFTTFGTARIVVENVSYEQAEKICADIERVPGVKEVAFDDSPEHYNEAAALFSVTFDGENDDEVSVLAMDTLRDMLSVYDLYVNTEVGNPLKAIINRELLIVDGIAALIIVVVLLFTSKTYAEIPVLLITFGAAALLNMGTNYMMGEISFVTDSVAIVLQLAMAIDYAIILCHRYMEEHENKAAREAAIAALSKAIPEISASSLTTVSGADLHAVPAGLRHRRRDDKGDSSEPVLGVPADARPARDLLRPHRPDAPPQLHPEGQLARPLRV